MSARYSYFQHFGKSVLVSRYKESTLAVVFTAYFDAAGDVRHNVLAVAGAVSDFAKWKRFELAWQRILDVEHVSCFHMTDFVSFEGEFKTWRGPENAARRGKFILDLRACAKKFTNKAFAAAIPKADYTLVNRRYEMSEADMYPFSICGRMCVELTEKWKKKHGYENVLYVFEDGDEHKGNLQSLCRRIGVEPEFINKKCPPVQAADLLAWITRSGFDRVLEPGLTFEKADKALSSFNRAWRSSPMKPSMAKLTSYSDSVLGGAHRGVHNPRSGDFKSFAYRVPGV